jgi:hypothetical protein
MYSLSNLIPTLKWTNLERKSVKQKVEDQEKLSCRSVTRHASSEQKKGVVIKLTAHTMILHIITVLMLVPVSSKLKYEIKLLPGLWTILLLCVASDGTERIQNLMHKFVFFFQCQV